MSSFLNRVLHHNIFSVLLSKFSSSCISTRHALSYSSLEPFSQSTNRKMSWSPFLFLLFTPSALHFSSCSMLVIFCLLLLVTSYWLLITFSSLVVNLCLLLFTSCLLFVTFWKMLVTFSSLFVNMRLRKLVSDFCITSKDLILASSTFIYH